MLWGWLCVFEFCGGIEVVVVVDDVDDDDNDEQVRDDVDDDDEVVGGCFSFLVGGLMVFFGFLVLVPMSFSL